MNKILINLSFHSFSFHYYCCCSTAAVFVRFWYQGSHPGYYTCYSSVLLLSLVLIYIIFQTIHVINKKFILGHPAVSFQSYNTELNFLCHRNASLKFPNEEEGIVFRFRNLKDIETCQPAAQEGHSLHVSYCWYNIIKHFFINNLYSTVIIVLLLFLLERNAC